MVTETTELPVEYRIRTGDPTYATRVGRYQYVMKRLADKPKPNYEQIGKELGISKQNVGRLVKRGTVRPAGHPRSDEGRIKRLSARLAAWQGRRLARLVAGRSTAQEDEWISKIEKQLVDLGNPPRS